jgi:hypothetical protein
MLAALRLPLVLLLPIVVTIPAFSQSPAAERRAGLVQLSGAAASARYAAALADPDPVVRRTGARLLLEAQPVRASVELCLKNDDALVRREGALALPRLEAPALPLIAIAMKDPQPLVRQAAVTALSSMRPKSEATLTLLQQAEGDASSEVQSVAAAAVAGYYTVLQEIPLPTDGWKLKRDPQEVGEREKWFAVDFSEADWVPVGIGKWWEDFGVKDLRCGWYRLALNLPRKPAGERVELRFDAVDENAWVWVNGKKVGEHALGTAGWDKPFGFDVTNLLQWGKPNQVTVRVVNDVGAGGIYQPVSLRVQSLGD